MSYAIIRNEKFTKIALKGIYRHNERKNNTYSNKDINYLKRYSNYHIKQCNRSYWKEFDYIREKNQLKGFIKSNSIVACEYIITSDKEFFDSIGEKETKRYFETAYEFIKKFKNLGDEYIISATVHLDESTPHMHLVYIPVIHKKDEKSGKIVDKVCASEFWKGQLSYKKLQDEFYEYIKSKGFDLERGMTKDNKHYQPEDLKKITNYEMQELFKDSSNLELEVQSDDIEVIK